MLVQAGVMPDLAAEAADTVVAVQHYHTHGLVTALHKHREIQREGPADRRTVKVLSLTDRGTDARPFYRPRSSYHAGSVAYMIIKR